MRAGDVIADRFELDQIAGSGGMGEVFRARDRATGTVVAVKVLRRVRGTSAARFEREAEVLAELSHPGIVRYIAHGLTPSGEPFLVMEWLEGEDLLRRLLRSPLTIGESVTLARRAAEALAVAHARGIVHRDLKPTNLFLEGGAVDRVKLLDFGIAQMHGVERVTETGMLLGTPGYMAPEQARSGQQLEPTVDVFALGCVLYECLTGRPAFAGDHPLAILAKILVDQPPAPRDLRHDMPAPIDALVTRMLSKDPDVRPRDGAAAAEALSSLDTWSASEERAPMLGARPAALTTSERRGLCVLLIGADRSAKVAEGQTPSIPADDALRREVEAFGGRLEQLADGSAVVTVPGAKLATDQAALAARCALALVPHVGDRPMVLSTGRGQVNLGMPLGDAIDRAVRLLARSTASAASARAEAASVLAIDEVTAALLDARFEVREGDAGLSLIAERELAEGTRTLLGRPTPCVGRDRELLMLAQMLESCVEESMAHALLVTAPPGMGKSRLAHEFLRRARQREDEVEVWIGRADSLRAGSAFGLLGQLIRGAAGIHDGEPLSLRRDKLLDRVGRRVAQDSVRRVAEFLGEIVGAPFSDEDSAPLRVARREPQLMGDQMRRAWEDFLAAECAAHPVLLVLEDLHWGDLPTVRFLDGALRNLRDKPWMVVAFARPEVHGLFPNLWDQRGLQEIRLKELGKKASERLVRQVLGASASAETVERLVSLSDGNAFYLEELIRATAERRGEALPETVLSMVQSRLGALDGESRRVLRAASIFGEVCWSGGVSSLLGGVAPPTKTTGALPAAASARLAQLTEREVLVQREESRFPGEQEFTFRHALLREGAYAMLTEEDRALGHRLAGEWLSAHGEQDPIVLAEHFEKGGEPAAAGRFYLRAAEQALRGSDADAAVARARRGVACGVPEDTRLSLLSVLCEAAAWGTEGASAAMPHAEEVMRLAPPGSAPYCQAASARLAGLARAGRRDEYMATLMAVKGVEPSPEALGSLVLILCGGVFFLNAFGQIARAEGLLSRADEIVAPVADREPVAMGWLGILHAQWESYAKEDPWASLQHALRSQARFREANHRRGLALAQLSTARVFWSLGALDEVERELRAIESADEELGDVASLRPFIRACALADRGALEEAGAAASGLVESGIARRLPVNEGRGRWALAEVRRRQGDLDAAEREARGAVEKLVMLALDHTAANATLAAVWLAQGRVAEALSLSREALAKAEAAQACAFFRGAYLRLVHAEALDAAGERDASRSAIAEARRRILATADRIDDPSYRRRFLDDAPENARTLSLARLWLG